MIMRADQAPAPPDPQEILRMLKQAEELTSPPWEELMAMDDTERIARDRAAESAFSGAVHQIEHLAMLERDAINRVLGSCATPEAIQNLQQICASMDIRFEIFVIIFTARAPTHTKPMKKYEVAGMRCVHYQAGVVREALERELENI